LPHADEEVRVEGAGNEKAMMRELPIQFKPKPKQTRKERPKKKKKKKAQGHALTTVVKVSEFAVVCMHVLDNVSLCALPSAFFPHP
jgi:hypothetical protein